MGLQGRVYLPPEHNGDRGYYGNGLFESLGGLQFGGMWQLELLLLCSECQGIDSAQFSFHISDVGEEISSEVGRDCRGGYIFLQNIMAIEGVMVMVSLEVWVCCSLEECGN